MPSLLVPSQIELSADARSLPRCCMTKSVFPDAWLEVEAYQ